MHERCLCYIIQCDHLQLLTENWARQAPNNATYTSIQDKFVAAFQ
uniref:Uncharacterized protein n=1 Tax=Rhizophora mucronata TaxID=61149 RepID=A0A2P2IV88_RHIMU